MTLIMVFFGCLLFMLLGVCICFRSFVFRRVSYNEKKEPVAVRLIGLTDSFFFLYGAILCAMAAVMQTALPDLNFLWGWALPLSVLVVYIVRKHDVNLLRLIMGIVATIVLIVACFGLYQTEAGKIVLDWMWSQIKALNMSASTELLAGTALFMFGIATLSLIQSICFNRVELNCVTDTVLKKYSFLRKETVIQLVHSTMALGTEDVMEYLLGVNCFDVNYKDGEKERREEFRLFAGVFLKDTIEKLLAKPNRGSGSNPS